ncbi:hypothetical protein HG531_011787 [Fusarium graminearum]|nr:hypothetical protein HG531_011787 [Fusarium graminearum]
MTSNKLHFPYVVDDLLLLSSDLVGAVTVSQGDRAILGCLEIDGDAKRSTKLVVSAISLANAGRRVIDTAGDTSAAKTLRKLLKQRLELRVGRKGNKENLALWEGFLTPRASSPPSVPRVQKLVLADLDLAVTNTSHLESDATVVAQLLGELLSLFLGCSQESSLDSLGILLELRTKLLPLDINLPLLNNEGSLTLLTHNQRGTGLLGVHAQIVSTSVGTTNTLNPARAGEQLGIPTVASVMSHLVGHVLTEAQLVHVDTNLLQELVDASKEIAESLVVNETILNSLANLDSLGLSLARKLSITVEGGSKRHLGLVELEELGKVEELALSSLGTEVTRVVAAGTDSGLEHEVEGNRLCRLGTGSRVSEVVLLDELAELGAAVVVDSGKNLLVLLDNSIVKLDSLGLGLLFLLLGAGFENGLDEVVGSENLAVLGVLAHPVGKLVDVTTGLENLVRSQDRTVNLEHILLEDEVFPPLVNDGRLERTTGRTIVEQTTNTAVDLEGGGIEHASSEDGFENSLVKGLALEGCRAGSHCVFGALLRLLQFESVEGS